MTQALPIEKQSRTGEQMKLFEQTKDEQFDLWIHTPAGRKIAERAIRLSMRMRNAGWKRYGIAAICEHIRWQDDLAHGPDTGGFKANHNWESRLARFIMNRKPEFQGFFKVRPLAHERKKKTKKFAIIIEQKETSGGR
jgi:hypothetical protein